MSSMYSGHEKEIQEYVREGLSYRAIFEKIFDDPNEELYSFVSFCSYLQRANLTKNTQTFKCPCEGCVYKRPVLPVNKRADIILVCTKIPEWRQINRNIHKPYWCPLT